MAPSINRFEITCDGQINLNIVLSAGGDNNLNPTLLLAAFGDLPYYTVCRKKIYNSQMEEFK